MKKKSAKKKTAPAAKSIFRIAGEAIGTIGHEIAEGKDKLVEASQAAVEKISSVKKSISTKITGTPAKRAAKKKTTAVKKAAGKLVKKAAKKITKKAAKAAPKKAAAKKSRSRK